MARENTTFVFVPGAWFVPEHFASFADRLQKAGYSTIAAKLPSCDPVDPGDHSVGKDAHFILHHIVLPQLNAGKEVIMVMHSYGACPGSAAISGQSKGERSAQGLPGGVIGLIYLCGYISVDEDPRLDTQRYLGSWCGLSRDRRLEIDTSRHQPSNLLFNQTEHSVACKAVSMLKKQSFQIFINPLPSQIWSSPIYEVRRAYIVSADNNMMPLTVQTAMLEKSKKRWEVLQLERADHAPWLSQPDKVFDFLVEMATRWVTPPTEAQTQVEG